METEKESFEERQRMPERPDYEQELVELIKSDLKPHLLRERLQDYHENDIAAVLGDLTREERRKLYQLLGTDIVSEIFAYLDDVGTYIDELETEKAADILESMDADDAVDILDELEDSKRDELIHLMDEESRHDIDLIHSYTDDEIGSCMTTNFICIKRGMTVRQAMKELVSQAAENDNISTLYVLKEDETFYGSIALKDLIIARDYTNLEDLIVTSYPYVYANEVISACIEELKDYSEDSIPVLDNQNHILGVITAQDIVEVVDDELGEDYAKLAGLTAEEDLKEPLLESMKKRMPWLMALLLLGMLVSSVVGIFEQVISQIALIVSFQSLVLDMAGNVGTQSLAVTIRVLTDEALSFKQKLCLVWKEGRVGFSNGMVLGLLSFLCIGFYIMLVKGRTPMFSFAISACIGIALLVSMVISSLFGTLIPLFFHKIHIDPAVASGPLITTVNDLVAVVSYYGLTWLLLIQLLHLTE